MYARINKLTALAVVTLACLGCTSASGQPRGKLKVAVVTGGHKYDEKAFLSLFENQPGIDFVLEPQQDHSELFEDISEWTYDVIVFYSMTQEISDERRRNLIELLDRGVGIVALHHVMGAFQSWPEFHAIIGGKYITKPKVKQRQSYPGSTFRHDTDFRVHIQDPDHPITQGMKDFDVHDETYKQCIFSADNHILLTTDHPTSDTTVGWVRTYRNSRIFTIQMGHGPAIFADPTYRKLVGRAILWTAGRLQTDY